MGCEECGSPLVQSRGMHVVRAGRIIPVWICPNCHEDFDADELGIDPEHELDDA